jgi:hypothetical protein
MTCLNLPRFPFGHWQTTHLVRGGQKYQDQHGNKINSFYTPSEVFVSFAILRTACMRNAICTTFHICFPNFGF